jgi:phosphoglycolate phosphatase-like HAD superfamily hydrolase
VIRRLVLFDIDGTLLTSAHAGRRALRAAFQEEYPELDFFDTVRFDGKTDPQILAELHTAAGCPERITPEGISVMLDRYVDHLHREIAMPEHPVVPCPGVTRLLDALDRRADVTTGLLTGNVITGARVKLGAAGIDFDRFALGAFGSDSAHRSDLPAIAARRAASSFGHLPHGEEIVIVGDTPADVACGSNVGARAIAVATGSYSTDELAACHPHAVFATLADTSAVLEAIDA